MNALSSVRGITLTDYFKHTELQSFEDSEEMECLVGDLMTKPSDGQGGKTKIQEKSEGEENGEERFDSQVSPRKDTEQVQSPKPSLHYVSAKNSRASKRQEKPSKLSSVELRASSIKIYKSDQVRIRQVSNSPYQRKLSKHKDAFKTILAGIPQGVSSIHQHPLILESKQYPMDLLHKYSRHPHQLGVEENKSILNSRQVGKGREMERGSEMKKGKFEGVHSSINAYAKKIREHQKAKHQL